MSSFFHTTQKHFWWLLIILWTSAAGFSNFASAENLAANDSLESPSHGTDKKDEKHSSLYYFDLPPQPLQKSLADYSRIVSQMLLFNPTNVQHVHAPSVQGVLNAEAALGQLLQNTDLIAEPVASGWLIKPIISNVTEQTPSKNTATTAAHVKLLDETLVVGRYRNSLRAAVVHKRIADQQIDVVMAEDIGQFPAHNIAEALQRTPGISVVRDRGEALFLSVRGLPTNFNLLTLNGQALASNENVRTSEQYGQRFHYDTLPAELIAGVDVHKSTTASDREGAIGGTVNVKTFTPFALEKPLLSMTLSLAEAALTAQSDPRVSMLGSWINSENNFGVLLATAYSERSLRQDRALNFRWYELPKGLDSNGDGTADTGAIISPGSIRPTLEYEQRQRLGIHGALQWKAQDNVDLRVNLLSLRQDIDYDEFSYSADYDLEQLMPETLLLRKDALIGGQTSRGSSQISRESAGLVDENLALDATLEWRLPQWNLEWTLAASRAQSYNSKPIRRTRLRRKDNVAFEFFYPRINDNSLPDIHFKNLSVTDFSAYPGRRLEWRINDTVDREAATQVSIERLLDGEIFRSLKTGISLSNHQRGYHRRDAVITEQIVGEIFPADYFLPFPADDFLGSISKKNNNLPREWLVPNEDKFWASVDLQALSQAPLNDQDLLNSYSIDESITAVFTQANFSRELQRLPWRGNLGIRYVHSRQSSSDFGLTSTYQHDYDHWLPSANVVIELTPQLLWRSSIARVMKRPDFQDLVPRLTLSSGEEKTATSGNPYLQPITAWQYDTGLEWYFDEGSLLSTSVFYKDIKGFIQTQFLSEWINGQEYQLAQKANGSRAHVSGFELNYQHTFRTLPRPFNRLGVQTNYTYTDSRARYRNNNQWIDDALADVAKNSINISTFYAHQNTSVRLSYSWRDEVVSEVGTNNLATQNSDDFGSLNLQASYQINNNLALTLEGINLTNAAEREYVRNKEFASYTHYGRTFALGIKLKSL